jgi:hypothetical protein
MKGNYLPLILYKQHYIYVSMDISLRCREKLIYDITTQCYLLIDKYQSIQSPISFHKRQVNLLKWFIKYFNFTIDDLVAILIYTNRLSEIPPIKFMNPNNGNYILLALIVLYCKMYNDKFYQNSYYANITHIKVNDLNLTEKKLLCCMSLYIDSTTFQQLKESTQNIILSSGIKK